MVISIDKVCTIGILSRVRYIFDYSEEKNLLLKEARGIGFEDIIRAIEKGQLLDNIDHFDRKKYPNQKILIVKFKNYVYAVPYVIDKKRKVNFLKTIYPNKVLTCKYLK